MQVKKDELKALTDFIEHFTPQGTDFYKLTNDEQLLLCHAQIALRTIEKRKAQQNNRTWNAIRKKRVDNPNYGRPQKEYRKTCKNSMTI